jgi:hypothetical protein
VEFGVSGITYSIPRSILVKLVAAVILVVMFWPIPGMIGFSNPGEGVILGRYTLKYFGVMCAYLLLTAAWAGFAGWLIVFLNEVRLVDLQGWVTRHLWWYFSAAGMVLGGLILFRTLHLAGKIVLPSLFGTAMLLVPGLLLPGFSAFIALTCNKETLNKIDRILAAISQRLSAWLKDHPQLRFAPAITVLSLMIGFFLICGVRPQLWDLPLDVDGSVHVYIGRNILRGGIPYKSLFLAYPPMRYIFSLAWNLPATLLNVDPGMFARAMNIVLCSFIILISFEMGRQVTNKIIGGLISAAILLGTEVLYFGVIGGPLFAPMTIVFMMLGLWMAQQSRWFWAGSFLAVSTLSYSPISLVAVGAVVSAFLQGEHPRVRSGLQTIAGGAAVLTITVVCLLYLGLLTDAYRQVVLAVLSGLGGASDAAIQSEHFGLSGFLSYIGLQHLVQLSQVFSWIFRGDWELLVLVVGGLIIPLIGDFKKFITSPKSSTLYISALLLLASVIFDQGDGPDSLVRIVILTPLAADAIMKILSSASRDEMSSRLNTALESGLLVGILLVGLADSMHNADFEYSGTQLTYGQEKQMAEDLHNRLQPGQQVFALVHMWYFSFTGENNAVPIRTFNAKSRILGSTGWTASHVYRVLDEHKPAVVMWLGFKPDGFEQWLNANYVFMGIVKADRLRHQEIYVLKGQTALQELIETWPLNQVAIDSDSQP